MADESWRLFHNSQKLRFVKKYDAANAAVYLPVCFSFLWSTQVIVALFCRMTAHG
jgi:hypothetical protein